MTKEKEKKIITSSIGFDRYIQARYPILLVPSPEEARVEEELNASIKTIKVPKSQKPWRLLIWSHSDGWITGDGEDIDDKEGDPIETLQKIRKGTKIGNIKLPTAEEPAVGGVVFLLRDFHPFFQAAPIVQRLLRDCAKEFQGVERTIVLCMPYNQLPKDLERDVQLVEFSLPKREIMSTMVAGFLNDNKAVIGDVGEDEKVNITEACLGLTTNEAMSAMAKGVVDWTTLKRAGEASPPPISSFVLDEKAASIRKNGVLEWYNNSCNMEEIGGLSQLKKWLTIRKQAFTEKARKFGLPAPRGLMLVGTPGCGKSLSAKACAANFGVPLIKLDVGRVFAGLVGQSEANMRSAIQTAEAVGRCVLWIDEIEKAFAGLGSSGSTDSGVSSRVFGSFITWMQEKTAPVFIIATCNKILGLPPELTRKGRFDDIFFVDAPDVDEREEIFKIHIKKRGRDPEKFDLKELAKEAKGFSGAEIEEAVITALFTAFYRDDDLQMDYLKSAIYNTTPLSKSQAANLAEMRDWADKYAQNASKEKEGPVTGKKGRQLNIQTGLEADED